MVSSASTAYPCVRRDDSVTSSFFGREVADPYRHLENATAPETVDFADAQAALALRVIDPASPRFSSVQRTVTELVDHERFSTPRRVGDHYYFFYNPGLLQQYVLYRMPAPKADADAAVPDMRAHATPENVFLDFNALSDDGTVALSTYGFSEDGAYFAYAASTSGSDWVTIRIMRTSDKSLLPDVIEHAKFTSISWTNDNAGFFYTHYPPPPSASSSVPAAAAAATPNASCVDLGTETDVNMGARSCYHRLHTAQASDAVVYRDEANPNYFASPSVSDCGRYLILSVSRSTAPDCLLWITELGADFSLPPCSSKSAAMPWKKLVDSWGLGSNSYIANDGPVFYFMTNRDAPRYKIVKYDLSNPALGFVDVIPMHAEAKMENAIVFDNDKLVVTYLRAVVASAHVHELSSGRLLADIELPELCSVSRLTSKREHRELFVSCTSYLSPNSVFRITGRMLAAATGTATAPAAAPLPICKLELVSACTIQGYRERDYVARLVMYKSADGTVVPMTIVQRKEFEGMRSADRPTLLYGYGGFSISLTPSFSATCMAFLRLAPTGILAVPNLRGGGEYGEEWHEAGILEHKQNVFDDFQHAAMYLASEGYTCAESIAINGGSNGGLLVCACINQKPDLFGAAVAEVPVTDMMRYHKFTIGHFWKSEYGSCDVREHFEALIKYSPLHTVTKQEYPATLLLTSDHDDRVVPLHSYKYIAELQHHSPDNKKPLLLYVEKKAGHGAGKPTKKIIESSARKLTFILNSLNVCED